METEIWTVAPRRRGHEDPPVCRQIRVECDQRDWAHRLVRAEVRTNSAGKSVALLGPELALNLYQRAHRVRLGVLALADVYVRLNPTRHVLDERWLSRLSRLVRYKAFHARVGSGDLRGTIEQFEAWTTSQDMRSERDPRVLPLHTFCPGTDCSSLDKARGLAEFDAQFGPPTRRVCEQGMNWTPDPSHHGGREPQHVAGLALTPGLHWDVVRNRGSGHLLSLVDVWEVARDGHLNVYPNGFVRPSKGARRVASYGVRAESRRPSKKK